MADLKRIIDTDLEKIIDKINFARKQGYITQEEVKELREFAQSRANKKGELGTTDKEKINKRLNDALNKAGLKDKKEGGLNPSKDVGGGGNNSGGNNSGGNNGGGNNGGGNNGGGNDKPSKWDKVKQGYNKLSDKQDRDVIRDIFDGPPDDSKHAFFQTLSENRKDALVDALKDGKITAAEKKNLINLFKKVKGPGSGGGGGGGDGGGPGRQPGTNPPSDLDGDGTPNNEDPDDDGDGIPDNRDKDDDGDGDLDKDDKEPTPLPTVKGGNKKIEIPKPANRANYTVPKNSDEPILMPDLNKKVVAEVERLTKRLMNSTKEFIEGGINYDGIDSIPDDEILTEDGESFFDIVDYNSPGTVNSGLADERLAEISRAIQNVLDQGNPTSTRYNYAEFIDLFELGYNNSGDPYYRFSIKLVGEDLDDITVTLVKDATIKPKADEGVEEDL